MSITYSSSTKCAADPAQNYTSTIIFTCQRGLELVSHHFHIWLLWYGYLHMHCDFTSLRILFTLLKAVIFLYLYPGLSTNAEAAGMCLFVWVGDPYSLFRCHPHKHQRLPAHRLPAPVHLWPVHPLWWRPGELIGLLSVHQDFFIFI